MRGKFAGLSGKGLVGCIAKSLEGEEGGNSYRAVSVSSAVWCGF